MPEKLVFVDKNNFAKNTPAPIAKTIIMVPYTNKNINSNINIYLHLSFFQGYGDGDGGEMMIKIKHLAEDQKPP